MEENNNIEEQEVSLFEKYKKDEVYLNTSHGIHFYRLTTDFELLLKLQRNFTFELIQKLFGNKHNGQIVLNRYNYFKDTCNGNLLILLEQIPIEEKLFILERALNSKTLID